MKPFSLLSALQSHRYGLETWEWRRRVSQCSHSPRLSDLLLILWLRDRGLTILA